MLKWLLSALVVLGIGAIVPAWSVEAETGGPPERGIHFKADTTTSDGSNLRYIAGFALFAGLVGGWVLLLRRRIPGLLSNTRQGARLKVIERRVIGPRTHLYLIEVDNESFGVVQAGDRLLQLDPSLRIPSSNRGTANA